jgi:hypothetical protein
MAKITVNELNNKVTELESKMSAIDSKLDKLMGLLESQSTPKEASEAPKNKGTVKNSKKATKVEVTIEDGTGKGQGKKFVKVVFDGKPSEKTLETLKLNGFKYFFKDHSWSTLYTEKKLSVAQSLIK